MALARRTRGAESFIWPGFVDGLATLLMVIIFVLMVFFLIQINLAQRVSGQDATLNRLRGEISELATLLNIERQKSGELAASNQQLALSLEASDVEIAGLTQQITALEASLGSATGNTTELESALAAATARADQAEAESRLRLDEITRGRETISTLEARITSITENQQNLEAEISERDAALARNIETINASRQEILILTQSVNALKQKLGQLQALLDEKESEAREAKEASVNLSRRLNDALSSKVAELQRFRSEFFGQLRDILKDRTDIRIVGDRFVFQSEVLFALGSADIGPEGERKLMGLSSALRDISDTIPTDIDWVLQVSGHTDNLPINTPRFRDNWDLSTERAISVVRYLVLSGIDPNRLSATGFGQFQPIDTGTEPEALARNRRIEFKITRR